MEQYEQYSNFYREMDAETTCAAQSASISLVLNKVQAKNGTNSKNPSNKKRIFRKVFFALLVVSTFSANAQDYRSDPKENERVIGNATDTINIVLPSNYSQLVYSSLLEKTKKEYPNKVIDLRNLKTTLSFPSHGNVASAVVSAKVVEFITAEEWERDKAERVAQAEREKTERLAAAKAKAEKEEADRLAAAKTKAEKEEADRLVETKTETEKAKELERERLATLEREKNKPPTVNIIDPINGSIVDGKQLKISYVVSEKKPTSIKILVDGRAVQLITDAKIGQNTVMVSIPDKDFRISIVAQSEFGASNPATVNLIRSDHIFKPSLYVLAIGISNYDDRELRLQFPAKDASDFTQALIRQAGLLYESVDVKLLTDRRATAENIRDGLSWLQTETTNRDIAMLYIAGHGVNDNFGDFFFMPVNADINRINSTCVSYTDIKRTTTTVAGKLIVFMDACHSGNVLGNSQQRAGLITQAVSDLTGADSGPVVFTSSTGRQFSLEAPEWNNGAFTKALVEGLTGKADLLGRKTITIKSLDYYIANRVKELTGGKQSPTTIIPRSIPDFPIAIVTD